MGFFLRNFTSSFSASPIASSLRPFSSTIKSSDLQKDSKVWVYSMLHLEAQVRQSRRKSTLVWGVYLIEPFLRQTQTIRLKAFLQTFFTDLSKVTTRRATNSQSLYRFYDIFLNLGLLGSLFLASLPSGFSLSVLSMWFFFLGGGSQYSSMSLFWGGLSLLLVILSASTHEGQQYPPSSNMICRFLNPSRMPISDLLCITPILNLSQSLTMRVRSSLSRMPPSLCRQLSTFTYRLSLSGVHCRLDCFTPKLEMQSLNLLLMRSRRKSYPSNYGNFSCSQSSTLSSSTSSSYYIWFFRIISVLICSVSFLYLNSKTLPCLSAFLSKYFMDSTVLLTILFSACFIILRLIYSLVMPPRETDSSLEMLTQMFQFMPSSRKRKESRVSKELYLFACLYSICRSGLSWWAALGKTTTPSFWCSQSISLSFLSLQQQWLTVMISVLSLLASASQVILGCARMASKRVKICLLLSRLRQRASCSKLWPFQYYLSVGWPRDPTW